MESLLKQSPADLMKLLAEKREALRAFRFGAAGNEVKNVRLARAIRKEISQVLTVLNSKKNA